MWKIDGDHIIDAISWLAHHLRQPGSAAGRALGDLPIQTNNVQDLFAHFGDAHNRQPITGSSFNVLPRIGAHSMGATVALRWAARHPNHVERVVCWGAPIYASPEAARSRISGSVMARLFALDTRWAKRACAISCRHRVAAGWVTAALQPSLPLSVARAVPLHTWPAYRDAMRHLVIETDWQALLAELDKLGIRLDLMWGSNDKVGDHNHARAISASVSNSTVTVIPRAGHHLPMSHVDICVNQLTNRAGDQARQ